MNLIMVAHGTRRPEGIAMISDIADQIGVLLDHTVQTAFVDVLGPTPSEVLSSAAVTDRPAIVVPAFLSRGYHVRTDLPTHVAASEHPDVTVAPALGPSPHVARITAAQMAKCGCYQGDSAILAAADTSDPAARGDLRTSARSLSELTGSPVGLAFAATGEPSVPAAVANARTRSRSRVLVASYPSRRCACTARTDAARWLLQAPAGHRRSPRRRVGGRRPMSAGHRRGWRQGRRACGRRDRRADRVPAPVGRMRRTPSPAPARRTVICHDSSVSRARRASTSRWPTMPCPTTTTSRVARGCPVGAMPTG